jgi:proton-coupled amino acid transporter
MSSSPARDTSPLDPARVVAEHLPAGYTAEFDGHHDDSKTSSSPPRSATPASGTGASSLKLQGGDVHRDLFKLNAAAKNNIRRRATSFHSDRAFRADNDTPFTVGDQLIPGGFRRAYLLQRHTDDSVARHIPLTRSFVEFLDLYGSFAGEDLVDTDEEEEVPEEQLGERRPLLRHGPLSVRAPRPSDASTLKTFFTLIKAFVGTGIMFLPKAFSNGGILFSILAMLAVSSVTMVAFHLLLQLEQRYPGGYGEIGEAISGRRMRNLILASVALSQLGFVCAGMVFVAENLHEFFASVSGGSSPFSTATLIALQVGILIPLAWIRNISKLGPLALLADACIVVGIGYLYWYTTGALATAGPADSVVLFNPARYTLMLGSAIFTFEGIGLILPIQASMAQPQRFESLLALVMVIITAVFTSVGALCYAVFGADTRIEIISNLPRGGNNSWISLVDLVQLLYAIAVLVGTPVQLFPALRIAEARLFGPLRSGKGSPRTKWAKNAFRFAVVVACALVALAGAGNLDRFVALIGSVACVPLVYVYPAYLHWKGVAEGRWVRLGDVVMMVGGVVCMVFTTAVTVADSFMGGP